MNQALRCVPSGEIIDEKLEGSSLSVGGPESEELERSIRIKLGQKNLLCDHDCKNCENCANGNDGCRDCASCRSHLRFNFDARDDESDIARNKAICELFYDRTGRYRFVVHSWKGGICAIIMLVRQYNKYDYWDAKCYCLNDTQELPYKLYEEHHGDGTVNILKKTLTYIDNCNGKNKLKANRILLNVPYAEKDLVKKFGAWFDGKCKKWFILDNNKNKEHILAKWTEYKLPDA
ncbi:MAG: hypothetical protein Hyperionvirus39_3 [Hyperionvirus sp.]|uniref:DUF5710 domain-containing protein n=1 Tax=Hyperionvirus sp. TaxID=2487770 RepID=A0A3G5AFW0_9VIRU|nr:MAG: hypothetical protein Hyperionvirus39_3 [Hyperionvirus sp.]